MYRPDVMDSVIVPQCGASDERREKCLCDVFALCRIGNNLDAEFAMARAIELGEEYDLPAAECEATVLNENRLRSCGQGEFKVRVRVALGVLEFQAGWNDSVERCFHVTRDVWIVALVDQDTCCRVRDVDVADAI